MFETQLEDGVIQVGAPGGYWLASGWNGGFQRADVAYAISVPEGWERKDLDVYITERLERAGFRERGPTLLTGVDLRHLRGATSGPVTVLATAGMSNPAALPMEVEAGNRPHASTGDHIGTVNLLVLADRALKEGAMITLSHVAVEAKAATLVARTGMPGTTTDAVVLGTNPDATSATFAGSGTEIGAATRACVRDAVTASLNARYESEEIPTSVAEAEYGTVTHCETSTFAVGEDG